MTFQGDRVCTYWLRFKRQPLEVRVLTRTFHWRCIYGVQFGPWFFGVIKGSEAKETA